MVVGLPLHTAGAFAAVGEEFVGGGPEVRERDFGAGRADQLGVEVVIPVPRVVPVCRVVGHVAAGCAAALSAAVDDHAVSVSGIDADRQFVVGDAGRATR